jgi:methionine aminotransferase
MKSKLPHIGTTIFTVMSKMANEYQAINLSQGFPNFPVDERLISLLKETADENTHQYAPMAGHPLLMQEIASLTLKNYGRTIKQDTELLITAGATQAIFTAIQALVHVGDEVIILDPAYDCYAPAVDLCCATPVHISLEKNFTTDWNKVESACNQRTRMLIVNNPHNPSGRIYQEKDLEAIEAILAKYPSIVLISDEVYEYITFEQKHISANTRKAIIDRTIITSSFGKTFHITGWKIGYLIAPEHLMVEIKKVHQYVVFCVNSVAQVTLAKYLREKDVNTLGAFYQEKRDTFRTLIKSSRFELMPSEGSYFQTVNYSVISSENDVQFCERLIKEYGVAAIPLSVFYKDKTDNHIIRFCFAKDEQTLIQAAEKLCKI